MTTLTAEDYDDASLSFSITSNSNDNDDDKLFNVTPLSAKSAVVKLAGRVTRGRLYRVIFAVSDGANVPVSLMTAVWKLLLIEKNVLEAVYLINLLRHRRMNESTTEKLSIVNLLASKAFVVVRCLK